MKAQFDLRPSGMLAKERKQKSFNLTRLIAVLLVLAFFASTGGYIVMMGMNSFRLQKAVQAKREAAAGLRRRKSDLEKQVTELKAKEKVFIDTLQIMQEDLPTIEVLNALETEMDDYGIAFTSLKFVFGRAAARGREKEPDVVELTGLVTLDTQVVDFSERLRSAGVFSDVLLTATTRDERTGLVSFTLRMPYLPIGQIQRR